MEKYLKSKFFMIIVIVTIALVMIPSIFSFLGIESPLRATINLVLTPIQKLAQNVTEAIAGYTEYFTEFDKIVAENNELKQQLSDLREQIDDVGEVKALNEWLYHYLELKKNNMDFQFINATVTGRSSTNYSMLFTLDKGSSSGITKNMPVITDEGLLGYIAEVGINWCKVKTLLDYDSSVGVKDKRSGAIGVLETEYELSKEGKCRLSYLSQNADIRIGDCIITSGFSELYPEGLIIGYVSSVEPDYNSRSYYAVITIAAEISDADLVMILYAYEKN